MRKPTYVIGSSVDLIDALRALRAKSGHTQADISQIVGCSRPTIAAWETAQSEPSVQSIVDLLAIYGYDLIVRPRRKR